MALPYVVLRPGTWDRKVAARATADILLAEIMLWKSGDKM
jgi:hypothetical protein